VTDNAANIYKMREQLAKYEELDIMDALYIFFINLFAHDIEIPGITFEKLWNTFEIYILLLSINKQVEKL